MPDIISFNNFNSIEEFLSGSLLLIDKPYDWSSFDALNKIKGFVRNQLGNPKFKIGHAGTLDPLATGLLVVCTGKYTKLIESIQGGEKEYTGTIYLGKTTPSYDLETQPEGSFETRHITEEMVLSVAKNFIGEQMQTPPIYSAKQVNGKRAYTSARNGEELFIPAVPISINYFEIQRFELPEVDFLIRCSKGTYIRTIAHEFGQRLNSGSFLKSLRRTASKPYSINNSMTIEGLFSKLNDLSGTLKA
jgi:tRNA pseudouridine55 synthase